MPNWKKLIVSGSDAELNSLNITTALTASGLIYPTTDGTSTQAIITDGAGNLSFGNPYSTNTIVYGKNLSGGTIEKGTPLYFTGSGTEGNTVGVYPADAGNPARMPAGGIAGEQILDEAEGIILLNGFINGVDTSAFNSGDEVFVAVGGGYTNVVPTGSSNLIQKLGNVEKSDANNGSGVINGPGAARSVPNIQQGYTWVGDVNGVAQPTITSSLVVTNAISASYSDYSLTSSLALQNIVDADAVEGGIEFTKGNGDTFSVSLGGITTGTIVTSSFNNVNTTFYNHNFNSRNILVKVYDTNFNEITPSTLTLTSKDRVDATFASLQSGTIVIIKGGASNSVTGSYSNTVSASLSHSLNSRDLNVGVFDENFNLVIPSSLTVPDASTIEATFNMSSSGTIIAFARENRISSSFSNVTSTSIPNNLNTLNVEVAVYDANYSTFIPENISVTTSSIDIDFATTSSGNIVIMGGDVDASKSTLSTSFKTYISGSNTYNIQHNLDEEWPLVQVYNESTRNQTSPTVIKSLDADTIQVTFTSSFAGYVIINS